MTADPEEVPADKRDKPVREDIEAPRSQPSPGEEIEPRGGDDDARDIER